MSAIKCNTRTKKDRAAGATTRHVILCDVASPWPRPCSRRLAHSSQSVPHDALGLSWTALRARTRPCQTRPPPGHTSAALAPNTKNPPSGGCALQAHAHRVFRTAPKPAIRPIRRRGRADHVGAGRGAVSLVQATCMHAVEKTTYRGATIHHIAFLSIFTTSVQGDYHRVYPHLAPILPVLGLQ